MKIKSLEESVFYISWWSSIICEHLCPMNLSNSEWSQVILCHLHNLELNWIELDRRRSRGSYTIPPFISHWNWHLFSDCLTACMHVPLSVVSSGYRMIVTWKWMVVGPLEAFHQSKQNGLILHIPSFSSSVPIDRLRLLHFLSTSACTQSSDQRSILYPWHWHRVQPQSVSLLLHVYI